MPSTSRPPISGKASGNGKLPPIRTVIIGLGASIDHPNMPSNPWPRGLHACFKAFSQGSVAFQAPSSWRWTFKIKGKTACVALSEEQATQMTEAINNHKRLEETVREMREITQTLILETVPGVAVVSVKVVVVTVPRVVNAAVGEVPRFTL